MWLRGIGFVLMLVFLAPKICAAEPVVAPASVRTELTAMERSIDRHFRDITERSPIGIIGYSRGGYLEGYGAVFSFEVNLVPVPNVSPFRPKYTDEEKRKLNVRKRQRLEDLEDQLRGILLQGGTRLQSVPVDERIALVVSLFHFRWEDLTDLPSQVVVQATRQTLLDRQAGRLEKQAFRKSLSLRRF